MQRQQVAVDQKLEVPGALRRRGGHEVRRVHEAVRRGMMLVEAHAVVAELVHLLPGRQMLGIGADGDVRLEEFLAQRIGQFRADLHVLEAFAIGQQIEDKDLHANSPGLVARRVILDAPQVIG